MALDFTEATRDQIERLNTILDRIPLEHMHFLLTWAKGEHGWYVEEELREWEEQYK